jgi:hypothetical protein
MLLNAHHGPTEATSCRYRWYCGCCLVLLSSSSVFSAWSGETCFVQEVAPSTTRRRKEGPHAHGARTNCLHLDSPAFHHRLGCRLDPCRSSSSSCDFDRHSRSQACQDQHQVEGATHGDCRGDGRVRQLRFHQNGTPHHHTSLSLPDVKSTWPCHRSWAASALCEATGNVFGIDPAVAG